MMFKASSLIGSRVLEFTLNIKIILSLTVTGKPFYNKLNSEKFQNFSSEPKFGIFEGKAQK